MPDLAAMALRPINQGTNIDPQKIGLDQGVVAWETLVSSLASGDAIQTAVDHANQAVAAYYNGLPVTSRNNNPQAIWTPIGDSSVCISDKRPATK